MGLGGGPEGILEGGLEGGRPRGIQTGRGRGLAVKLRSVKSRSGLVQVWYSTELKFNSFELDSEEGRLVSIL